MIIELEVDEFEKSGLLGVVVIKQRLVSMQVTCLAEHNLPFVPVVASCIIKAFVAIAAVAFAAVGPFDMVGTSIVGIASFVGVASSCLDRMVATSSLALVRNLDVASSWGDPSIKIT